MKLLINQVFDVLNENIKKIFNVEIEKKDLQNSTKKRIWRFSNKFCYG